MKPKVYLETTIPSYLTAWPTRDLLRSAHQQVTREWWRDRRADFDLFVSEFVIREVSAGDPLAAADRLRALEGVPILKSNDASTDLALELERGGTLPEKAAVDVLHIALAVVSGMDYLLTWNCSHIANATLWGRIETICRSCGYHPPIICTPMELLES